MPSLPLRGASITLAQALKAAGLADSGGQAKILVRNGDVSVNGAVVTQPGRKLVLGDRFQLGGQPAWDLVPPDSADEEDPEANTTAPDGAPGP